MVCGVAGNAGIQSRKVRLLALGEIPWASSIGRPHDRNILPVRCGFGGFARMPVLSSLPLCSDSVVSTKPQLRSLGDRLRQVGLFELGGLLLITPPFAWGSGLDFSDSLALLAVLALIAAVWNGCYNTSFDYLDGRISGRTADRRPFALRCLHALGFELGLFVMALPIIVYWTGMGWLEAAAADILLAITYTIYALLFNLAYDRIFPILPRGGPDSELLVANGINQDRDEHH